MKVTKNEEHNSIEVIFGKKPNKEAVELLKAYGFRYFAAGKTWYHSLKVDGEFFEEFIEERIKPLAEKSEAVKLADLSEEERAALVAEALASVRT
jgi:hypothetical protein